MLIVSIVLNVVCAAAIISRLRSLRRAVHKLCSQRLDDLCWMDLYELAEEAGCPTPDLTLLPKAEMLNNCRVYVECLGRVPGRQGTSPAGIPAVEAGQRQTTGRRAYDQPATNLNND